MLEDYYSGNHSILYSGYSYEIFKWLNRIFPNSVNIVIIHIN